MNPRALETATLAAISATPAIVGGKIYRRGHRHLYAIGATDKP